MLSCNHTQSPIAVYRHHRKSHQSHSTGIQNLFFGGTHASEKNEEKCETTRKKLESSHDKCISFQYLVDVDIETS